MLAIDFGALAVSWWLIERVYHRQYFWSNIIGDSIGLPLIAGFTTLMLQHLPDHHLTKWYTSGAWYVGVLIVGILIISFVTFYLEIHQGNYNWKQEASPSKAWHAIMWPVFFWVLVAPAPAALMVKMPSFGVVLLVIYIGVVIWAVSLAIDLKTSPSPLGGVVEFSWPRLFKGEFPSTIRVDQWRVAHKQLPEWFFRYYDPLGRPYK